MKPADDYWNTFWSYRGKDICHVEIDLLAHVWLVVNPQPFSLSVTCHKSRYNNC
jgi:hypothetical protein